MASLLITSVPPGYQQAPDSVADTGPSDLDKAASDDGAPDARQVLVSAQFVAGYQRLWQSGENRIIVAIYRFGSPSGAATYLARTKATNAVPDPGTQLTPFPIAAISGSQGLLATSTDGHDALATFAIHGTEATPSVASTLSLEQYQRL
jgi:hypothetical protein